MKKLGYVGAAAIASVLSLAATEAQAGVVTTAAQNLVTLGTVTGNGGSFVTKAVKDGYDLTSTEFKYLWTNSTLGANGWYVAITTNDYFTQITNISQIAADQIFAVDQVLTTPTYAGHAVVITGAPIEITEGQSNYLYAPFYFDSNPNDGINGWRQYAVPIADSTSAAHGHDSNFPDSRWSGNTFNANVPGTAYIRLYADQVTGTIVSYSWSVQASEDYDQTERPFAIGAITPSSPNCIPLCTRGQQCSRKVRAPRKDGAG
jgi:hypothetical protein